MKEQDDKDYEDLLKAERKVKREKKKNNYRRTNPECCLTCRHVEFYYEGEIRCNVLYNEDWIVNGVSDLCVCDKYERSES